MEDAEVAAIVMGSSSGTVRATVDWLRRDGIKAGLIKIRCFRPFPVQDMARLLEPLKGVAVLERATGFGGASNPLTVEIGYILHNYGLDTRLTSYVYGLGGRDTTLGQFRQAYEHLLTARGKEAGPEPVRYLGLEE